MGTIKKEGNQSCMNEEVCEWGMENRESRMGREGGLKGKEGDVEPGERNIK